VVVSSGGVGGGARSGARSGARVLVVGAGGREHALAWALGRSASVSEVLALPGNAGIAGIARTLDDPGNVHSVAERAAREGVDLVVIGPEAPLVAGLSDACRERGLTVYGPSASAARLEASKAEAKAFMLRHGIPTASAVACRDAASALEQLRGLGAPIVVKRSGLAGGKGVTIALDLATAEAAVTAAFAAGEEELLLEELLTGREVSLLVLCDGRRALPLRLAQDYKQALDGDLGPMTGGMGTVAPVELLDEQGLSALMERVVGPTLMGLAAEGTPFVGTLFVGLMLTERGPLVLEYNVRFGDPETQALLPLLETDLFDLLASAARGDLGGRELRWRAGAAACVVLAAPGYPEAPRTGTAIDLPGDVGEHVLLFHAGTRLDRGVLRSAAGRVLNVVGLGATRREAVARAYRAVERIGFPDAHYRRDIGAHAEGG
jgi:phosphoribosylamine---glycine ligase